MTRIRVIAAVVDTTRLTLYQEDGKTIEIPQGDHRLRSIVDQTLPLSQGAKVVEINLLEHIPAETVAGPNPYRDYEEKVGGLTKFFRVAKKAVSHIFGNKEASEPISVEPVTPMTIGFIPGSEPAPISHAINDIMAHAEPVSAPSYDHSKTTDDHTMIAVKDDKIIPGIEDLAHQIDHAVKHDNTKGMEAFMKRLAGVIDKRGHKVEDILRFMQRGDLPLADDGCIIAYKVLKTVPGMEAGYFVDCHSGKVKQRVGSYVCQDEKLIDPSRSTQCSTGLHIARRGYLQSFNGNIITMVKICPEDIIAVPVGEPDKVRAKGYHIISEIPAKEHEQLRRNAPMKGSEAQRLLAMAIAGDHIGIIEEVRITAAMGGSFEVIPMEAGVAVAPQPTKETPKAKPVEVPKQDNPIPAPKPAAPAVDPKQINKEIEKAKASPTKAEQARKLYTDGKIAELFVFKKAAKKSYESLGFTAQEVQLITGSKSPVTNGQDLKANLSKSNEKLIEQAKTIAPLEIPAEAAPKNPTLLGSSLTGDARKLYVAKDWTGLYALKKLKKKSWAAMGFFETEIETINENKPS